MTNRRTASADEMSIKYTLSILQLNLLGIFCSHLYIFQLFTKIYVRIEKERKEENKRTGTILILNEREKDTNTPVMLIQE